MLDCIIQGFLRDSVQVHSFRHIGNDDFIIIKEAARNFVYVARAICQFFQGCNQAAALQFHRMQKTRNSARLIDGAVDHRGDFFGIVRFFQIIFFQFLLKNLAQNRDAGQKLPETVMQILPDSSLLVAQAG